MVRWSLALLIALGLSACVPTTTAPYGDDPLDDDYRTGIYLDYYGYCGGCYNCGYAPPFYPPSDRPDRPDRPARPDLGPRPAHPIYYPDASPNRPAHGRIGAAGSLRGGGGGRRR